MQASCQERGLCKAYGSFHTQSKQSCNVGISASSNQNCAPSAASHDLEACILRRKRRWTTRDPPWLEPLNDHRNSMDPHYLVPHCTFGLIYTWSIPKTGEGHQAVGAQWGLQNESCPSSFFFLSLRSASIAWVVRCASNTDTQQYQRSHVVYYIIRGP